MTFHIDCGGYADIGPRMAKAILADSAGPYNIEHMEVDCYTVYTNHSYVTSFRGFGHVSQAFCLERMMDKLSFELGMDQFDIRLMNALKEGDYTPTQVKVTLSNMGNLNECLTKLREIINCVIHQLISIGAVVLRCSPEDLMVAEEKVYVKADPSFYVLIKALVHGYKYENGNTVMGTIIGRGSYTMNHLTMLEHDTGKGKTGFSWTVGAQAIEIEYDTKLNTYRLLKAATVIDVGKVLNPKTAKGVIMGGCVWDSVLEWKKNSYMIIMVSCRIPALEHIKCFVMVKL